jgi:stage II sporulation SpoAA-like protein
MPVTFIIDRQRRLLIAHASGVLVDDDLQESRRTLLDDPDFDRDFNELFDAREVEEVAFSAEAMARMAQTSVLAREVRRAFVAATPYQYRMACLFVTLAQPYQPNVQVFRDIDEALAWLAS